MTALKSERKGATNQNDVDKPTTKQARPAERRSALAPLRAKSAATPGTTKKAHFPKAAGVARPGTKTAKILELLERRNGATLTEIMKATGWQPHSVRGFLSGTLRRKLGVRVDSIKRDNNERTYQISSK